MRSETVSLQDRTGTLRITLVIAGLAVGCGSDPPTTEPFDPQARRAFITKVHGALHPTAPPLAADRVEALIGFTESEIVEQLYDDPATLEAVLKVALYFIGAPVDRLHDSDQWASEPFAFENAAAAAHAFRAGGDPLGELFTTRSTIVVGAPQPVREDLLAEFVPNLEPLSGTFGERRATVLALLADKFASFRAFVLEQPDSASRATVCNKFTATQMLGRKPIVFTLAAVLGVPARVTDAGTPPSLFAADPSFAKLGSACDIRTGQLPRATFLAELDGLAARYDQAIGEIMAFFMRSDGAADAAFDALDVTAFGWTPLASDGPPPPRPHFYPRFWQVALNSSTNFDRRRGAYILDRFFCDDLKPVGAALPDNHVGDQHASDPKCQACHYKLDPMAGYFRRHGILGSEFTADVLADNGGFITFDDEAQLDFAEYDASWLAEPGSSRTYNIGYIRSTHDDSINSYGSDLTDLGALLAAAPEVEACFVKRLFQYFNGSDQAVDPGFLDDVAADAHDQGSGRLRRATTRILAGATFQATKRNTNTCYDLAPGADTKHRPPCEVASTLATYCTSCHGPRLAQAGLDLTVWDNPSVAGFGFKHIVDGDRVARRDTFARMLDRVETADLTRQMPLALDMPLRKREDLALWLRGQVDAAAGD